MFNNPDIYNIIKESSSIAQVLNKLGLYLIPFNYKIVGEISNVLVSSDIVSNNGYKYYINLSLYRFHSFLYF